MSTYYILLLVAFMIGQGLFTAITVYNLQVDKTIGYWTSMGVYLKAEIGSYVIAVFGLLAIMFILNDYLDLTITRADLANKQLLSFKEQLMLYYRTASLFFGIFAQYLINKIYNRGKKAINEHIED